MKIGVNFTSPHHLDLVKTILDAGRADFCEILIDNFLSVEPLSLLEALSGRPVAFHIMRSKFLTRPREELAALAKRIRIFSDALSPAYVSDHLAVFEMQGRGLPLLTEVDYDHDFDTVRARSEAWQDLLGTRLLIENYPSILPVGLSQPDFLSRLCAESGTGILFDASNVVVSKFNTGLSLDRWSQLAATSSHFHVAGYSASGTRPEFLRDTHNEPVSDATCSYLAQLASTLGDQPKTISVERDANHSLDAWNQDLENVRKAWTIARHC